MKFPENIQIQTSSACNGKCGYCPYPFMYDEISHGAMPTHEVINLIAEAIEGGTKRICLYLMNEPLIDTRMRTFVDAVHEYSSNKVWTEISTNGILIKDNHWMRLYPKLTTLFNVNQQTPLNDLEEFLEKPMWCKPMGILYRDYMKPEAYWHTKSMFLANEYPCEEGLVDDRAGNCVNIKDPYPRLEEGVCIEDRLNNWMHILWNGDVTLCCQDWRRTWKLGNVFKQSLTKIFNGPEYKFARDVKPELCKRCARWQP